MMTATTLEMLGEVVAVARKRGLDPKPFLDIMTSTMFGGRAHKIYGDKIVRQAYAPGFVMPLAFKDVRLALAEAESAGAPMPSVGVVRDRMITGIARGYAVTSSPAIADGMVFWGSGYEHLNSPTVHQSVSNNMFYAFALSPDAAKH
jgi:3-hydroxyisobutyrate dehydrogenase-like beta-hydroxyacid dehydrogenase